MLARLAQLFRRALPNPPPQAGEGKVGAPVWVEVGELRRWLAGEGAPIVVDVRGPDEFDGPLGHIEGARNIPLAELPRYTKGLAAEGRALVMVCLTDKRSSQAAAALIEAGVRDIAVLRGGMKAWREALG
jgi:rhodanese-related sulfurtransferase